MCHGDKLADVTVDAAEAIVEQRLAQQDENRCSVSRSLTFAVSQELQASATQSAEMLTILQCADTGGHFEPSRSVMLEALITLVLLWKILCS